VNQYLSDEAALCSEERLMSDLATKVNKCARCDLGCEKLVDGHDPHVMGYGNPRAEIMFIAEAPGLQECIYKRPLTPPGTSGKIYEKILKDLDLTREDVWTTNTVLCRPPKNRNPEPWEVHKCKTYLKQQLDIVEPKIVITFGRFAAQILIGSFKITKEHGQLRRSESFGVNVFPVYHPAYVARGYGNTSEEFKKDIKKLKRILSTLNNGEEDA